MSPDLLQIIIPLTFLGICCLAGEILVHGHRERIQAASWPRPHQQQLRKTRSKSVGRD